MTFGALHNEVVGSHTEREWDALVLFWGWRCFYCGKPVHANPEDFRDELVKDHVFPRSRGGSDFIVNIRPACFNCNRLKGNMTLEEFREARPVFFTEIHNQRRFSYEVVGLCTKEKPIRTAPVQTLKPKSVELPPEGPRTDVSALFAGWLQLANQMAEMNDGYPQNRDDKWYAERRARLRAQAHDVKRLQLENAGQLSLDLPSSEAKPPHSDTISSGQKKETA
jgi:hypothetical protein